MRAIAAPSRVDELLTYIDDALMDSEFPQTPDFLADNEIFAEIRDTLIMLRESLFRFSKGDIRVNLDRKGYLISCVKNLQAQLRHLTWHAGRLSDGARTHPDFMGNLFESFNQMAREFYNTLNALRESEANLVRIGKEINANEERWKLAATCTQDGIFDIDLITCKAFISPRLWEILKWPSLVHEDIMYDAKVWARFFHPDYQERWLGRTAEARASKDPEKYMVNVETRLRGGDGEYRWLMANYMILKDKDGEPYRFIGAVEDIQEKREREDAIRLQATHDQLTGLPNRYLYNDRIAHQMMMCKRSNTSIVLVVWDLDGFKNVNDTYGHLAGDQVLVEVADRMRICLRESDTLARFGGDEFVMILTSARGCESEVAFNTTGRIFEILDKPIDVGCASVTVGASCGIAFFPEHATDAELLFDLADKSLYVAKKRGKHRAEIWPAGSDDSKNADG